MNLFYKICKYDYNDPNYVNEWMEIDEYVVQNGSTDFDNYLFWEEQMLNLYSGFLKFFGDNVACKVNFYPEDLKLSDYSFIGLKYSKSDLDRIVKINFDYLSRDEKEFLIRCHIRGHCTIHLFTTRAHLLPMGDYFYAQLRFPEEWDIWDIIPVDTKLIVYIDFDHDDETLNEIPVNAGHVVTRNLHK